MLPRYQYLLPANAPLRCRQVKALATINTCTLFDRPFTASRRSPRHSQTHSQLFPRLQSAAVDVSIVDADTQTAGYAAFTLDSRMTWPSRTHAAGRLTAADAGKDVTVCGWVDRNRNLGGLGFMDIRDHTGLLQVGADSSTVAV